MQDVDLLNEHMLAQKADNSLARGLFYFFFFLCWSPFIHVKSLTIFCLIVEKVKNVKILVRIVSILFVQAN